MTQDLRGDPLPWIWWPNPAHKVYVYRIRSDGRIIPPYLLCCAPYPSLLDDLRVKHGGGDFRLLIREGRKMVFSGNISIEGWCST